MKTALTQEDPVSDIKSCGSHIVCGRSLATCTAQRPHFKARGHFSGPPSPPPHLTSPHTRITVIICIPLLAFTVIRRRRAAVFRAGAPPHSLTWQGEPADSPPQHPVPLLGPSPNSHQPPCLLSEWTACMHARKSRDINNKPCHCCKLNATEREPHAVGSSLRHPGRRIRIPSTIDSSLLDTSTLSTFS